MSVRPQGAPTVDSVILSVDGLGQLLSRLRTEGRTLVGPTVRDGAIVQAELEGLADLPAGLTEVQEPGRYRLERRGDVALFGFSTAVHSFKQLFFAPRQRLFSARRTEEGFAVTPEPAETRPLALIGARACDLAAIAVQDRVFAEGPHADPHYVARRADVFVVALSCGVAGGTCFCVSMGTGPRATRGFDLALTELLEGEHRFLVQAGTERGAAHLAHLPTRPASADDLGQAEALLTRTAAQMGRTLETDGLKELLYRHAESPRWESVARRCLSCANCTLACPTCFCGTVEEVSDLTGQTAERVRRWDSCFTFEHSHVHGGPVRQAAASRYRQWMTHKLASWIDQFGTSGCVGCGRCITWCPVGIDITEEAAAFRAAEGGR
ncbi:MAG: 4Fe-4S dicluster domain-containing protein [Deltaproteobacteria bacterium]|nr:4Fe-4S dicluster domain-containing protein [Deltaproteobacteria bacterium]